MRPALRFWSDLTLVLVTLVWGVTFSLTKQGVAAVPPLTFLALRFTLAFPFLLLALCLRTPPKRLLLTLEGGVAAGFVYFLGFAFQTAGLRYTTASKAAFLTGLSVLLVPVLLWLLTGKRPSTGTIWGVALSLLGLALLTYQPHQPGSGSAPWAGFLSPSLGDLLVLLCALAFAGHIILVGRYAPLLEPVAFTTVQVAMVSAAATASSFLWEKGWPHLSQLPTWVWFHLAFLALLATVGTTLAQVWAQRHTTPSRTAIIFTLEPVFAALFAFLLLGEVPRFTAALGGLLIISGVLISELLPEVNGGSPAPAGPDARTWASPTESWRETSASSRSEGEQRALEAGPPPQSRPRP
ncbi:MAG: DMT family transporter [Bacillota bacterium]|nr:DMT family transporter [Bacillota bacterium]